MVDGALTTVLCCGDRSRLGRAVLLAVLAECHGIRAVVVPTAARWARFETRLVGDDRAPVQRGVPSRLDPLRRFLKRLAPVALPRDSLDVAWGLPSPAEVAALCQARGAEVISADDVNDPALVSRLASMGADLLLTGAYPQIFREPLLRAAGVPVNIHPSSLPKMRGANPVYWALASGAKETGVTAHVMVARIDAGPILAQTVVSIADDDDYYVLYGKLVGVVPSVVTSAMTAAARGERGVPQDEAEATTFCEPRAADRRLDWTTGGACALRNRVRAGRAFTFLRGEPVEVVSVQVEPGGCESHRQLPGGTVADLASDGPIVAVGQERLHLMRVLFRGVYLDGPSFVARAGLRLGEQFE